ncbi:lecithin:cholesterol acyltransferase family protein, putative [Medicago truncatula]|uniref:Lecithin:cholesterol acyltransferase family protein, putative n=1 Tax=Medicago truncatula TaxID=3880 RepID=G7IR27_MEDTR|nr:lecithin:cholesterol acyltransferase family protein, putative [Medicago truncatula]
MQRNMMMSRRLRKCFELYPHNTPNAAPGHPSQVGSKFLNDLKNLIEKASNSNGGKPLILVSHRLGGLFVLELL